MRVRKGILTRLIHIDDQPVVVRSWQRRDGHVVFRAALPAGPVPHYPHSGRSEAARRGGPPCGPPAAEAALELAIERMRFALGVDDDLRRFYERFRKDPLIGPAVRRRPWMRPRRRPWPWEALAWAVTAQLIESGRAAEIQRRIVRRWGARHDSGGQDRRGRPIVLRDVPGAELVAARAPAELAAVDLSPARAIALIRCAREVASGRVDLGDPNGDRRLLAIREIGPWTVQCLGLHGRGDPDSLPAGDLAYVKLVGRLSGLGRRATVGEVEEFFAPYAPFRGLAGTFALLHWHKATPSGPALPVAA